MKEKLTKEQEPLTCEVVTIAYKPVLEVYTTDNQRFWLPYGSSGDILVSLQDIKEGKNKILEAEALKILYSNKLIDKEL